MGPGVTWVVGQWGWPGMGVGEGQFRGLPLTDFG